MEQNRHRLRMPDLMESIFDIGYLCFAIGTGIYLLSTGAGELSLIGGALALVLGLGDAFHLVPRVVRALKGTGAHTEAALGAGLFVSSITMTLFYLLLYEFWRCEFPDLSAGVPAILPVLLFSSALFRIIVCLFPQNNWLHHEGNRFFSLLRNIPFAITGLVLVILFALSGNADGHHMERMSIAIIISFACYFPVTLFAKKHPMVGMLMIPKTCAYIWMLVMLKAAAL
ncbi:MAG TPA: hypothetical protein DGX96_12840 [Lachnospiraceae bacterium]|jgi:hypothetical protein|nr:hypothetical protein [Lachnospiraceae bacterium]